MGFAEQIKAARGWSAPLCYPALGPLDGLGVGSGLPLLDPVDPNRLGVRLLSDVGPQDVVVRLAGEQPIEDVVQVDEDVEIVAMRTAPASRGAARGRGARRCRMRRQAPFTLMRPPKEQHRGLAAAQKSGRAGCQTSFLVSSRHDGSRSPCAGVVPLGPQAIA